ncbi:protein of unknown function [Nitrosotalea devaniterrae]|uniref:Uncharacterized protein n=1 Tax=Nitrosotalea devaniterrae TaxID=1078905 RepID=A0A128A4F4_9ARCH|nr:protein of unknown function [Candidatus Nitrosotalea devanaterra]
MEKTRQKTNEPYTWDINGEDYYWIIISENVQDLPSELNTQKNIICKTNQNESKIL